MRERIASTYGIPIEDLILEPIECVWESHHNAELDLVSCSEVIMVAVYVPPSSNGARQAQVAIWPGSTGHEAYYIRDVVSTLRKKEQDFVSSEGLFGPTKWEHDPWYLCAGSSKYTALRTSCGEMAQVVDLLTERAHQKLLARKDP